METDDIELVIVQRKPGKHRYGQLHGIRISKEDAQRVARWPIEQLAKDRGADVRTAAMTTEWGVASISLQLEQTYKGHWYLVCTSVKREHWPAAFHVQVNDLA